jgi:hypothetical protein
MDKMFLAELEIIKDKIKYSIVVTVEPNRFPFVTYPYLCSIGVFSMKGIYMESIDLGNMEIVPIQMTTVQQTQQITAKFYPKYKNKNNEKLSDGMTNIGKVGR